ncbi:MAG: hypothetical protein J5654_11195 [Victivallales bacterium]|nr:hypothetical protein [Victivallales bacterium]
MKEIYEAKANINLPSLGSTLSKGSRVELENGVLTAMGQRVAPGPDFQILVRHNLLVPLTTKQAAAPEQVAAPKTRPRYQREKLPVTTADDTIVKEVAVRGRKTQDQHIVDYENGTDRSAENERRIRGMKVDETISRDIPPRGGAAKTAGQEVTQAEPVKRLAPKHPVDEAARAARIQELAKASGEAPKAAKPAAKAAKAASPAAKAEKAAKPAKKTEKPAKKEGK